MVSACRGAVIPAPWRLPASGARDGCAGPREALRGHPRKPVSAPTRCSVDERLRRPRLVGRTRELAQLGELLRRAASGRPTVVALGGDAGSGKTRLLQEFLGSLPDGTLALPTRCYD